MLLGTWTNILIYSKAIKFLIFWTIISHHFKLWGNTSWHGIMMTETKKFNDSPLDVGFLNIIIYCSWNATWMQHGWIIILVLKFWLKKGCRTKHKSNSNANIVKNRLIRILLWDHIEPESIKTKSEWSLLKRRNLYVQVVATNLRKCAIWTDMLETNVKPELPLMKNQRLQSLRVSSRVSSLLIWWLARLNTSARVKKMNSQPSILIKNRIRKKEASPRSVYRLKINLNNRPKFKSLMVLNQLIMLLLLHSYHILLLIHRLEP
jgi:hypothetical protein